MVEHCSVNAEAMGSNPVEVLKIYLGLLFAFAQIAITAAMITFPFHRNKTCHFVIPFLDTDESALERTRQFRNPPWKR